MNHTQLPLALEVLFEAGITPHLIGEAGVGKSMGIYQYAERIGAEVIEVRLALMADAGDMAGLQEFVREGTGNAHSTKHILPEWFMKLTGQVEEYARTGKKFILFLDEMSRGHKDLLQCAFELIYDYALKGVKMSKDVVVGIVAASNPPTDDYAGSMEFADDAFQDRLCHLKIEPTIDEWLSFSRRTGVDNSILDFIGEYPQMLDKEHKPWSLDFVYPSRRSWNRLHKVLSIIEQKGPEYKEVELELMFGIVGEKAALAYRSFRDTYIRSIKAKDVLDNYTINPMVRQSVLDAIAKNRPDMLAQMNEEIIALLGKMKGLTQLEADNIAAVVTDLPIESAYALCQKLTSTGGDHAEAIRTIDGKTPGLWGHQGLVDRMNYIKEQRLLVKRQAKAADTSKNKGSKNIPF